MTSWLRIRPLFIEEMMSLGCLHGRKRIKIVIWFILKRVGMMMLMTPSTAGGCWAARPPPCCARRANGLVQPEITWGRPSICGRWLHVFFFPLFLSLSLSRPRRITSSAAIFFCDGWAWRKNEKRGGGRGEAGNLNAASQRQPIQ